MIGPRADRIVSDLMGSVERGDYGDAAALASLLRSLWPEFDSWSSWVRAGCLELLGEPVAAELELNSVVSRKGWLGSELLSDKAIVAVLSRRPDLRKALIRPASAAAAGYSVRSIESNSSELHEVVFLPGNGPFPESLARKLFASLRVRATLFRPRYLVAPAVSVWRDISTAVASLHRILESRLQAGASIVIVGMGAGAIVALEYGAKRQAPVNTIAVCPEPARVVEMSGVPSRARILLDSGDAYGVTKVKEWASQAVGAAIGDLRVDAVKELGHALPSDFNLWLPRVLEQI